MVASKEMREGTGDDPASSGTEDEPLAALIARMAANDERALEAFYDKTFGRTYALALRIVRDAAAAEEVAEDTYFQAWREASRFDPARGRALAWLLTICRSRALDALRRRDPAEATADIEALQADVAGERADPLDLLEAMRRGSAVRKALERLPPQARQLVAFAFFRGLTHQEIAVACRMPLGTVKVTLHRACQQLKACLMGTGLEPEHE